jgi:hypothetical protein
VSRVLEAAVDTVNDDVIDANDNPSVSIVDSNLVIDFGGGYSLTVSGVTQLTIGSDFFFA